jgi:hypothetical protein
MLKRFFQYLGVGFVLLVLLALLGLNPKSPLFFQAISITAWSREPVCLTLYAKSLTMRKGEPVKHFMTRFCSSTTIFPDSLDYTKWHPLFPKDLPEDFTGTICVTPLGSWGPWVIGGSPAFVGVDFKNGRLTRVEYSTYYD